MDRQPGSFILDAEGNLTPNLDDEATKKRIEESEVVESGLSLSQRKVRDTSSASGGEGSVTLSEKGGK